MDEQMDVVVVGGGQAGLAMGYYLAQQRCSFVIVEAADAPGVAWRTRYDSLRLFTPAQYNSLPGLRFPAAVDTYPAKDEVADYLARYVDTFKLPVRFGVGAQALRSLERGYSVETDRGTFSAAQVVVATGPFQRPYVPPFASGLTTDIVQIHASAYRNPSQLPSGDVLIVGGGNSGLQIADELSRDRPVHLSLGKRPPRLPQRLLGRDLFWWLHHLGVMRITIESRLGKRMSRLDPVIGTDLRRLVKQQGVQLLGRAVAADDHGVRFDGGHSLQPAAVIWATGYRPDYTWIEVPVFDARGVPVHRRGVTAAPGLYFLGLPWLYRRGSALLGGVGHDAAYLARFIASRTSHRDA